MSRVSEKLLKYFANAPPDLAEPAHVVFLARELLKLREALTKFGLAHKKGCAAILWAERFNKLKDHLQRQAWRKVRKECDCGRLKALAAYDATEDGE